MNAVTNEKIDLSALKDIQDVIIDVSLPLAERRQSYLEQIGDPLLYRFGDTVIRVRFSETGAPLSDAIRQYLLSRPELAL